MPSIKPTYLFFKTLLVGLALLSVLPSPVLGQERELYIVTGAHQDIGFGFSFKESMDEYADQLKSHIELIEVDPEIRFSMGNTWNTKDFIQRYPQYKTRLKNLLASGKITTPAQWVGGEVNWFPGEFLVRTIAYPKYWTMSQLDYAPHWYQLNDIPSITPQLAQILVKSDVQLLQVSHPIALSYSLETGKLWYFVGLDGSRLPLYTMDYGESVNLSDRFNDWDSEGFYWAGQWTGRFKELPIKMSLAVTDRGTDAERSQRLKGYIKEWNTRFSKKYNFTTVMKTEEDFARLLKKEIIDKKVALPEVTGTANPWPWGGFAWSFGIMGNHSKTTHLLLTTEKLTSINELQGLTTYPTQQINAIWEKILWYPEHNWGGNSDSCTFKQKDCAAAYKEVQELLADQLKKLAGAVNYTGKGKPILVFNPLNWERSETVTVTLPNLPDGKWALRDTQENLVPAQILPAQEGQKETRLLFLAKSIPALGYKAFYLTDKLPYSPSINSDLQGKQNYIENTYYKVTVYPDGSIKSIYDKQEKRELVDDSQEQKFGNMNPYKTNYKVIPTSFDIIQGPARTGIQVKGTVGEQNLPLVITVSLSAYTPWVEHTIELDTTKKGQTYNFFYYAPFQELEPNSRIGIPYGSVPNVPNYDYITKTGTSRRAPDRGLDIADGRMSDVARYQKDVQKWLSIGDDDYSVDLAFDNLQTRTFFKNLLTPMVHLAGYLPGTPLSWRFLIRGHKGDWKDNNTPRFGWEASNPLLAVNATASSGKKLPETLSFLEITTPNNRNSNNIILTTFKKAFDNNGYVLRFYETEDDDTRVAFKVNPALNMPQAEVSHTNLLEQPFEIVPLKDNQYTVASLGNGIETLRFFPKVYTDSTPPAAVTNLTAGNPTSTTIKLTWTASGDDKQIGTAQSYDLRFTTIPINESLWDKLKKIDTKLKPSPAGKQEQITITGLRPETQYYFALKVLDEAGNISPISNIATSKTEHADTIPPAAIKDLTVIQNTTSSITLQWSPTGDDGNIGQAYKYLIGYAGVPVSEANWSTVNLVTQRPGQTAKESVTISGLNPTTQYYFAVKAADEVGNLSPLSNLVTHSTTQIKTVFFQNGVSPSLMYDGCTDTHISNVNELEAEMNYGKNNFTRNWAGGARSVLIRFTLDTIPKGTPLFKAVLKLYSHDIAYGDAGTLHAYRILQDWKETECTWIKATGKANWQKAGGTIDQSTDYGHGANGIVAKGPVKDGGAWVTLDVTRLVQDWLNDKAPNYGILIKGNCIEDCEIFYRSAEYKDSKLRPILEISY